MDRTTIDAALAAPVRFSHLRAYGRSAAHGLYARTHERKPTAAMELGTAVHAMMFGTQPVSRFEGVRRGKTYDEFVEELMPGTVVLSSKDFDRALAMVDALDRSPAAKAALTGKAEETLHFRWMGRDCRATPDVRGDGFVTDLKTTTSADPNRFRWHALKMAYHAQLRMQQIGCMFARNERPTTAYIVAVEVDPPHTVTVFDLTSRALEEGDKLLTLWMERLCASEGARSWPGYCESVVPLDVADDLDLDYGDDNGD